MYLYCKIHSIQNVLYLDNLSKYGMICHIKPSKRYNMAELLGIIAPLKKFLSATDEEIKMSFDRKQNTILSLDDGRIYDIPDFQREIRWDEDNVSLLIEDIKSGPKFLGNIILTKHNEMKYSIIDGQQRITILTMILNGIKHFHQNEIEIISPCTLTVESFSAFTQLMKEHFPEEKQFVAEILECDKLKQAKKYYQLWKYIIDADEIRLKNEATRLLQNLRESSFNIIINESDDVSKGIRYFIDVNLKGKQLDTEDIFKSYLFRNDSSEDIRSQWYNLKTNVVDIDRYKLNYPLLKILEHYFYCDLFIDDRHKGIDFGNNFLLTKHFKDSGTDYTYRKGTHIIEVINSNQYMKTALNDINQILSIILEIVKGSSITVDLKNLFFFIDSKGNKKSLDDSELKIIHNIMGKILKDSKIAPKALIMKYILFVLLRNQSRKKEDLRQIYGVYLFTVLFTIFENKKSTNILISILKAKSDLWYLELIKQINGYFSSDEITNARLLAQYKLTQNEEEEDYRFRCKSLATIYNYFNIKEQEVVIKSKALGELYKFITDENTYSLEHFIISNSEKHMIKSSKFGEYEIDNSIYSKYLNNFFNFIFIDQNLNSALSNYWLPEKIDKINIDDIKCEYSKMIIRNLKPLSDEFQERAIPDYKDNLDLFFARDFKDIYIKYAKNVLNNIIEKIKN